MLKRHVYITEEQDSLLRSYDALTVSEHIRRALDEYIKKNLKVILNVSESSSKKGVVHNGR